MKPLDRDLAHRKERTEEERRFLLWSIARANSKCASGPYLNVERHEPFESPKINLDALQRRPISERIKESRYYRRLLIAKSAKIAGTSGLMIGFNIGLISTLASTEMIDKAILIMLPAALCGLLGLALGWMLVLKKRTDLFGDHYLFYRHCFWQEV